MTVRKYLADVIDTMPNVNDYVVFTADLTIFAECTNLNIIDVVMSESLILPMAYAVWQSGKIPIIYNLCSFAITSNYDFYINTVMESDMDLIIINAGAGFVYNGMGHGHYLLDDVGMFNTFDKFWFIKNHGTIYNAVNTYNGGKMYIRLGFDDIDGLYDDLVDGDSFITTPTVYPTLPTYIKERGVTIIESLDTIIDDTNLIMCYEDTVGFGIGDYYGIGDRFIQHIIAPNTEIR